MTQFLVRKQNPNRTLEQFQKFNLPMFEGKTDVLVVEKWLRQISKILSIMKCTEEQKVSFAAFMFQGEAEHW